VDDVAEGLGPLARTRAIRLEVEVAACSRVWGDPDKVHQVLTNLVANALKFSPREGAVRVAAAPDGPDAVRLAVSDTGAGIPVEQRELVFDKFYQVGRPDGARPGGSGLGLTIARHLVELHGGRIWVEDAPGGGSTFVVRLPTAAAGGP
jgi:signal transduction histidine kinase